MAGGTNAGKGTQVARGAVLALFKGRPGEASLRRWRSLKDPAETRDVRPSAAS